MINDRPLWSADQFSVAADASIAYVLINREGVVLKSGIATGEEQRSGAIGTTIS